MGSNLHPSLAENLHPSLAEDMHGGGAQPAPIVLGATYWFDPSFNVTLDGSDNVASWQDRISGLVVSQATATRRPGWLASDPALNNRPGMQYVSAALQFLGSDATTVPASFADTCQSYATAAAPTTDGCITSLHDSGAIAFISHRRTQVAETKHVERNDASGTSVWTRALATTGAAWDSFYDDGVSLLGARNSTGETTAARQARPLTVQRLWIGARNAAAPYNGSIGHVVWFARKLSVADAAIMESWLDSEVA